ncbi:MAG: trypsin-like serine protease, partial [Deltaproteobacteria bacterium]|nr:trypsin-like serine protease [Deltaproteobacteria bacterium]
VLVEEPAGVGVPFADSTPPSGGLLPTGLIPESVLGSDDRIQIQATSSYPWRTIVKIYMTFSDGSVYVCSGSIIGRGDGNAFHVLTAGHCVHNTGEGGWATSIEVIPGLDIDYMPYGNALVTVMRSYTEWTQNQSHQHDWAVLTLDRRIGNHVGWMGRRTALSTDPIYIEALNVAGYPADKTSGLGMWFDTDFGRTATGLTHWYYMDTAGGQSGAPVWRYEASPEARFILTVHGYGNDGSGSNHGIRLDGDKFDRIISWIDSDTAPTDYADLHDDGPGRSGSAPNTVAGGDFFSAESDVRNSGTAASGGFQVSYYASTNSTIDSSDHLIGTVGVASIAPFSWDDANWSGAFPDTIPTGTYYVGWIVDSGAAVTEFDETNNTAYETGPQLTVVECTSAGDCSDSLFCTGAEQCVADHCQPGASSCAVGEMCDETADSCLPDGDSDGVGDPNDNCSLVANPSQLDTNADGYGNICDPDLNNDGAVGLPDINGFRSAFGASAGDPAFDPDADFNGDGATGIPDFNLFRAYFGGTPGPSGLTCAGTIPCP